MLHSFSERLTQLQQRLQMRVLVPLLGRDQATRVGAALASDSVETLLIKGQGYYLREIEGREVTAPAGLCLPSPALNLLDAPRAAASFVHNGM